MANVKLLKRKKQTAKIKNQTKTVNEKQEQTTINELQASDLEQSHTKYVSIL